MSVAPSMRLQLISGSLGRSGAGRVAAVALSLSIGACGGAGDPGANGKGSPSFADGGMMTFSPGGGALPSAPGSGSLDAGLADGFAGTDAMPTAVRCEISAGTSTSVYPTVSPGESRLISWSAAPAASLSACSVEHLLPDGQSHPDGRAWGSGLTGSRTVTAMEVGLHAFVLRCSGSTGGCSATASLMVLEAPASSGHVERTLGYTGTGGAQWVHVVTREAGATSVSVRSVSMSPNLSPPYAQVLTTGIPPEGSKSAVLTGTIIPSSARFTTTVEYDYVGDQVSISHSSTIDGVSAGAAQEHGTVSLSPNAALPYQRSLYYVGTGSAEYLHIATRRVGQDLVDVRTIRYNANLAPALDDSNVLGLATDGCQTSTASGTFVQDGTPFSTELEYCRAAGAVAIRHRAKISGTFSDWQVHGNIPLE